MNHHNLLPCATCPWRVGKDATTIPGYEQGKAECLLNTVGNGDDFRPIMACHGSTDEHMRACNGYLAREGWSNLNVRLLLMRGGIANPSDVLEECERQGIELEADYHTVLAKLTESMKEVSE